ncbi:Bone morphogenetic protein 7 [Sarcoptes scabiei]|uniref:Bone morphogenetic protein 7 n=1 Tax=Sarcoptes scabiei TaxID=52283 RepID=A0A132AIE7_SARSC|nr:Bone morphogenetic protein 7 [Sarcoptes scabiei]KPM10345.1 bone morphogenetic protein 7-like protein [Sarcoptes scabiei]UXI21739.1 valacyclovir hydrolase-like [Sarcoptes scabiei]
MYQILSKQFFRINPRSLFCPSLISFVWLNILVLLSDHLKSISSSSISNPSSLHYFYTDDSLKQSVAVKMLEKLDRQELQHEILHALGLDHRPRPKKHATDESASQYLMDLYETFTVGSMATNQRSRTKEIESNQTTESIQTDFVESDIIMSFLNQIKTQRNNRYLRPNRDRRFWFNLTNIPKESTIIDADFRIYRDHKRSKYFNDHNSDEEIQITLFQLTYGLNREQIVLNFVDSIRIKNYEDGWLRMNITHSIRDWIRDPKQNLGLYLQIRMKSIAKDLSPKSIGLMNSRGFKSYQPFMTVYLKSDHDELQPPTSSQMKIFQTNRARRAVLNRKRSDTSYYDPDDRNPFLNTDDHFKSSRSCQKRSLFVSFRELNWQDWIIAPEGYTAFFCHGDCSFPMSSQMNATNHAVLQQLIHIMNRYVPKPCCAPSQLSSIMVLYFDDNSNVVLKKFKNMVVEYCGCH